MSTMKVYCFRGCRREGAWEVVAGVKAAAELAEPGKADTGKAGTKAAAGRGAAIKAAAPGSHEEGESQERACPVRG